MKALKLLNVNQRLNQQHKKKIRNTKESKRKREKSFSLAAELEVTLGTTHGSTQK